ncbi:MAG: DNA polymerase III subunit chi [Gammaproteobacteria bacterium]
MLSDPMTNIEFYVLGDQARRQHDVFVCELIERAWCAHKRVHLHCLDQDMLESMDEILWTFHDISFIPHAILGSPEAAMAPVTLGCVEPNVDAIDTLFNLHSEVPTFFSQFEQVIETTGHDEHTRSLARARYRYYKDRGYPLATHQGQARA